MIGCSVTLTVGCIREPVPSFVMDDALADLPVTHQQQINAELTRRFGTPLNPRLDLNFEEDAASEDAAATGSGSVDPDQQRVVAGLTHGAAVFMRRCAGCHGIAGDGKGEAAEFLQPKPRDYRQGVFKFTSTPYGAKPLRKDLMRVVRRGARGTSMPAFPFLPDEDLRDVVEYVILLSYRGELARAVARIAEFDYDEDEEIDPAEFSESLGRIDDTWRLAESQEVLPVSAQPTYSDASIIAGRQAFLSRGCSNATARTRKAKPTGLAENSWLLKNRFPRAIAKRSITTRGAKSRRPPT